MAIDVRHHVVKFYYGSPMGHTEHEVRGLDASPLEDNSLYSNIAYAFTNKHIFLTQVNTTRMLHNVRNCTAIVGTISNQEVLVENPNFQAVRICFIDGCPELGITVSRNTLKSLEDTLAEDFTSEPEMLTVSDGQTKTILFNTSKVAVIAYEEDYEEF